MPPIDPSAPTNGAGHTTNGTPASINGSNHRPTVLHLGDPILYNHDLYSRFQSIFTVIRPELEERDRPRFIQRLRDKTWGEFSAIIRPFWNTGGEMGRWDRELIQLLPPSMKVMASAGAGFDWVETDVLGEHGELFVDTGIQQSDTDGTEQASSTQMAPGPLPSLSPMRLCGSLSVSSVKWSGPPKLPAPTILPISRRPTGKPCSHLTTPGIIR